MTGVGKITVFQLSVFNQLVMFRTEFDRWPSLVELNDRARGGGPTSMLRTIRVLSKHGYIKTMRSTSKLSRRSSDYEILACPPGGEAAVTHLAEKLSDKAALLFALASDAGRVPAGSAT
jgi:hypothetical protein